METEKDILQLLNAGNEDAIKTVFNLYYEKLCLYAESIVRDHDTAEDIVEDLFVYIWINIKRSPINTSLKNYLYKSIYNNCLKYLNKEG